MQVSEFSFTTGKSKYLLVEELEEMKDQFLSAAVFNPEFEKVK